MKRKQTSLEILTVTIAQHLLQSAQMSFALVLIPWKSWGRRIGNQSEQVQQFILYLYKILPAYLCIFVQLEHPEYHSIYIYIYLVLKVKATAELAFSSSAWGSSGRNLVWNERAPKYIGNRVVGAHLKNARPLVFAVVWFFAVNTYLLVSPTHTLYGPHGLLRFILPLNF